MLEEEEDPDVLLAQWKTEDEAWENRRREMQKHEPSPAEADKIRDRLLLSYYTEQKVVLERAVWRGHQRVGPEYRGSCPEPTHPNDTDKSFYVNDRQGFYHCYGCGTHGDIIRFIQTYQGKSYPDTMAFARSEVKRVALHQDFVKNAAATALSQQRDIDIFDPWTIHKRLRQHTKGDARAKRLPSPVTSQHLRRQHPLLRRRADMDLRGLAEQLDYTDKLILKNPLVRTASRANANPRMKGSLTIERTGTQTLVITARSYDHLPGSISLQIRGDKIHGLKAGKAVTRVIACYGAEDGISSALSAMNSVLSNRFFLGDALEKATRTGGFRTPELDPLNLAGALGSSERVLYEKLLAQRTPGIRRQRCWVLPELRAY